ncbi:MAG: hypothetical protein M1374_04855 [Firmicutes bacterium]|jgi:hypothetical protein|nr:hypothetical protein [Bacillota bacterium]
MEGKNIYADVVSANVNEKNIALLEKSDTSTGSFGGSAFSGGTPWGKPEENNLERDLDSKLERFTSTTRDLLQAVLGLEFQLAAMISLTEHFGSRYNTRATNELQTASDKVHMAETKRLLLVPATLEALGLHDKADLREISACAPVPFAGILSDARVDLIRAKERIGILKTSAEEVLGRRIALAEEALRSPDTQGDVIYGRGKVAIPHIVSNLL